MYFLSCEEIKTIIIIVIIIIIIIIIKFPFGLQKYWGLN